MSKEMSYFNIQVWSNAADESVTFVHGEGGGNFAYSVIFQCKMQQRKNNFCLVVLMAVEVASCLGMHRYWCTGE